MKQATRAVFATLAAVLGIALLGACSSDATKTAEEEANFVGSWVMVEAEGDEEFAENLAMLESFGASVILLIQEDGVAELSMDDTSGTLGMEDLTETGTWEAKDTHKIDITFSGEKSEATIEDGRLVLKSGGDKIFFERKA